LPACVTGGGVPNRWSHGNCATGGTASGGEPRSQRL